MGQCLWFWFEDWPYYRTRDNGKITTMSDGMISVDADHWLDEEGELPVNGPPELFRNALRMAQCIEYGGPIPAGSIVPTLIQCRWRPGGVTCRGLLMVVKTELDEIEAFCIGCERSEFRIRNWQATMWAEGPAEPYEMPEDSSPPGLKDLPPELKYQLSCALRAVRSSLCAEDIEGLIVAAESPNIVIQHVLGRSKTPGMPEVQALTGVLMAVWNATPRSELSGRTPQEAYAQSPSRPVSAGVKVGRNEPCPCGSGKKYKKCCGLH